MLLTDPSKNLFQQTAKGGSAKKGRGTEAPRPHGLSRTLGRPLLRFKLGSWAEAVALPVVHISEPLPIFSDAHEALELVRIRFFASLAR